MTTLYITRFFLFLHANWSTMRLAAELRVIITSETFVMLSAVIFLFYNPLGKRNYKRKQT